MSGIVGDNTDDGSGVINAPIGGATVSSSDPTTSTNAALGTQWANSSTGDYYVCTDATTDDNIWINVDNAQDSIQNLPFGGVGGGQSYGFSMGGAVPSAKSNVIQKYSFSSDGWIPNIRAIRVACKGVLMGIVIVVLAQPQTKMLWTNFNFRVEVIHLMSEMQRWVVTM